MGERKQLKYNSIKECICEVRFEAPNDIDVSELFIKQIQTQSFKEKGFIEKRLPLRDAPLQLLKTSPQMRFAPLYKYENLDYTIGFGFSSLIIDKKNAYTAFDEFMTFIKEVFFTLKELKSADFTLKIKNLTELRLRYVNIFDDTLFQATKLELKYNNDEFEKDQKFSLQINKKIDPVQNINISLLNNATIRNFDKNETRTGSVVDFDAVSSLKEFELSNFSDKKILDVLEKLHKNIENEFISLLDENYANSKLGGWV